MPNGIITRLKEGKIKNVIPKGGAILPDAPYVVVSIEGPELRVWVHFEPGQDDWLEDYWYEDLPTLLNNYEYETAKGQTVHVYPKVDIFDRPGYSTVIMNTKTGTISKEKRFDLP